MKTTAVMALALFAATACTRRVQVESEPNEPRYLQTATVAPAAIGIEGTYDYMVSIDGDDVEAGPMVVTRGDDGTYAVRYGLRDGGEVVGRNVRREGNTLRMDATTPDGEGRVELRWTSPDEVVGSVFVGSTLTLRATRR